MRICFQFRFKVGASHGQKSQIGTRGMCYQWIFQQQNRKATRLKRSRKGNRSLKSPRGGLGMGGLLERTAWSPLRRRCWTWRRTWLKMPLLPSQSFPATQNIVTRCQLKSLGDQNACNPLTCPRYRVGSGYRANWTRMDGSITFGLFRGVGGMSHVRPGREPVRPIQDSDWIKVDSRRYCNSLI